MAKKLGTIPSMATIREFEQRMARVNKFDELQIRLRDTLHEIAMLVKEAWGVELKAAQKAGNQKQIRRAKKHITGIERMFDERATRRRTDRGKVS